MKINIGLVTTADVYKNNRILLLNSFEINNFLLEFSKNSNYVLKTINLFGFKLMKPHFIIFMGFDWWVILQAIINNIPTIYIAAESPVIEIKHDYLRLLSLSSYFNIIHSWDNRLYNDFPEFKPFFYPFRRNINIDFPSQTVINNKN